MLLFLCGVEKEESRNVWLGISGGKPDLLEIKEKKPASTCGENCVGKAVGEKTDHRSQITDHRTVWKTTVFILMYGT